PHLAPRPSPPTLPGRLRPLSDAYPTPQTPHPAPKPRSARRLSHARDQPTVPPLDRRHCPTSFGTPDSRPQNSLRQALTLAVRKCRQNLILRFTHDHSLVGRAGRPV